MFFEQGLNSERRTSTWSAPCAHLKSSQETQVKRREAKTHICVKNERQESTCYLVRTGVLSHSFGFGGGSSKNNGGEVEDGIPQKRHWCLHVGSKS